MFKLFNLLVDDLPSVTLEVHPSFEDINNSATLQRFVACIKAIIIVSTLFMEQIVSSSTVTLILNSWMSTHK